MIAGLFIHDDLPPAASDFTSDSDQLRSPC